GDRIADEIESHVKSTFLSPALTPRNCCRDIKAFTLFTFPLPGRRQGADGKTVNSAS
ncbi:hypothetical protein BaRGS_00015344, partial [Batillaria attramentaria]